MKNKFIAIMTSIVLALTMLIPAMGATDDNWQEDNAPWNVGITNSELLGSYQVGTSKEFEIAYYPSGSVGLKAIRHIEITGDSEVSAFEYYENGKWNAVANFTSEITFTNTTYQKVHVTFNTAGIYTIKFWAATVSGEQTIVAKRVVSVSNDGIELYKETSTTKPTTDEATTDEPTTDESTTSVAEPSTDETIVSTIKPSTAETTPTIKPSTVETTTTIKPVCTTVPETVKVGTTSIKKATKKKNDKVAKISLKKIKSVSGYQIQVSTSTKFAKKVTKTIITKKTTYTIKSLKPGKKYYVRVRAYVNKGKSKIYGAWCKKKTIKFIK
jgi:hypothetical protein